MFLTEEEHVVVSNALELIRDEKNWACGYSALDANGMLVDPTNTSARRWCAVGAISRAAVNLLAIVADVEWKLLHVAKELYPSAGLALSCINDDGDYGHDAIVAIFEKALVKL